jgi:hypothetical protein
MRSLATTIRPWHSVAWLVWAVAAAMSVQLAPSPVYVALVIAVGTLVSWLMVPQPSGAGGRRSRSVWSAALGFFAALPIAYLVLVVAVQVLKPLLT